VVEPLVSEQWFVRMSPLAEPALAAVADGRIKIVPERFEKIYNGWLENIKVKALLMRCIRSMTCDIGCHTGTCDAFSPHLPAK
jgi:hypothetical protein